MLPDRALNKEKKVKERLKKERSGGLHLSYIAVLIVKSYL